MDDKETVIFFKKIKIKYFSKFYMKLWRILHYLYRIFKSLISSLLMFGIVLCFTVPLLFAEENVVAKCAPMFFEISMGLFGAIIIASIITCSVSKDLIFNKNKFSLLFFISIFGTYSMGALLIGDFIFVVIGLILLPFNLYYWLACFSVEIVVFSLIYFICFVRFACASYSYKYKKYLLSQNIYFNKPIYLRYFVKTMKADLNPKTKSEIKDEVFELSTPQTKHLINIVSRFINDLDDSINYKNSLDLIRIHAELYGETAKFNSYSEILEYVKFLVFLDLDILPHISQRKYMSLCSGLLTEMNRKLIDSSFINSIFIDITLPSSYIFVMKHLDSYKNYFELIKNVYFLLSWIRKMYISIEKQAKDKEDIIKIKKCIEQLNKLIDLVNEKCKMLRDSIHGSLLSFKNKFIKNW